MAGTGKYTRLGLSLQVALTAALAGVLAISLTWLSERPGLRVRYDLTATGQNSFDDETQRLLAALPDDVQLEVDAFFVSFVPPMTGIGAEIQGRFFRLLALIKESRRDIVQLTRHELEGSPPGRVAAQARMRSLGFRDSTDALNAVVLSYGGRRAVIRLVGDVSEINVGNPKGRGGDFVPPRLVSYRGEEAFVRGLLKVSSVGEPRALFSWGHGERDLYADEDRHLSRLYGALTEDGFDVGRWDSDEMGEVPADCDVLAIIGPQQPLTGVESQWVREFLARGGRLIAGPGLFEQEGDGGLPDLLVEYGIRRQAGMICRPYVGSDGTLLQGRPECMDVSVRSQNMARHTITDPLRRGDRRVRMVFSRPLLRGTTPKDGSLLTLLESDAVTWSDLPGPEGAGDQIMAEGVELMGPFALGMISEFPVSVVGPAGPELITERKQGRVLALGTPEVFCNSLFDTNRDFLLNSFNWAADRDFRVTISARDPEQRVMAVGDGTQLSWVRRVAVIGLPLLCLLLGLSRWALRRSS